MVGQSGSASYFSYAALLWQHLDDFTGDRGDNMNTSAVISELGELAKQWVAPTEFLTAMQNPSFESDTRIGWKYACSRAVYGTPTFFLNGVYLSASPAWTTMHWRKVIDPLL